jgi:competence protein ComEC
VTVETGPLAALAALVAGILAGERMGVAGSSAQLALGVLGAGAAWFVQGRARVVLGAAAVLVLGAAVGSRAADGVRRTPFDAAIATRAPVVATGVVAGDPDHGRFQARVLVRIAARGTDRVVLVDAARDAAMHVRALVPGDRVVLTGRLAPLGRAPWDRRARRRHAVARLGDAHVVAFRPGRGVHAVANRVRDVVLRGTAPLAPPSRALVAGFLLGDTRRIAPETITAYRDAGLSHLLAVSGANVAFVLALAGPVLRRLGLVARTACALSLITLFAAVTRFEPSVLRASAMAVVALVAAYAGRPAARIRVLAYAAIAVLLADPFLVRSVAFLLSLGASAGIALVGPWFAGHLRGPRALRDALGVSLAAQVGVLPVLLLAFGRVPMVTPLANLAAAPAAEALGVYGLLASGLAGVVPALGPALHVPTALLVAWITAVARAAAAIPLALDRRGALASLALAALVASVACGRARRAVPDAPNR